jgi:hypothetical protein
VTGFNIATNVIPRVAEAIADLDWIRSFLDSHPYFQVGIIEYALIDKVDDVAIGRAAKPK